MSEPFSTRDRGPVVVEKLNQLRSDLIDGVQNANQSAADSARYRDQAAQHEAGAKVAASTAATEAADQAVDAVRSELDGRVSEAHNYAVSAANHSSSSASSASAASNALLALGEVLAHGIGMFSVNAEGELIGEYNEPTVTSMEISSDGHLIVTY